MIADSTRYIPAPRAACVELTLALPHGDTTERPMPAPSARRNRLSAAETKPPATIAPQETAESGPSSMTSTLVAVFAMAFSHATDARETRARPTSSALHGPRELGCCPLAGRGSSFSRAETKGGDSR